MDGANIQEKETFGKPAIIKKRLHREKCRAARAGPCENEGDG
jgi:hypothetical protein